MLSKHVLSYAVVFATIALCVAKVDSPEVGVPYLYKGMMIWAFGWAFVNAYSIGANDVANAFANAVASRTITHRQACMIACVGELVGVIALGKTVTDTVRKKMVEVDNFKEDPYVFALGMSCVNLGSGLWVLAATVLCLPVSTTHAVVGSIVGIGIAAWGPGGVKWGYDGGVLGVVASWFISPILSAILASIFYMSVKWLVLAHPDDKALKAGIFYLPFYFFLAFGVVAGFMFLKGAPQAKDWPYSLSVSLTFGVAAFFGLCGYFFVVPWLTRCIKDSENLPWYTMFYHWRVSLGQYGYYEADYKRAQKILAQTKEVADAKNLEEGAPPAVKPQGSGRKSSLEALAVSESSESQAPVVASGMLPAAMQPHGVIYPQPGMVQMYGQPMPAYNQPASYPYPPSTLVYGNGFGSAIAGAGAFGSEVVTGGKFGMEYPTLAADDQWYTKVGKKMAPGMYMDVGALCEEDAKMHARAFQALPLTEEMFKSLQLTTCLFFSISHGANDIANALAPLASVWLVYSTGNLSSKAPIPIWIMLFGGIALDIGLVTMGHHIMAALGNRLTLQSPSRGFCIELGAMFTVMVFSRLGFPISTTHCLTGATTGVGLCNGDVHAVNWKLLLQIFGGWIITCPAAGLVTAIVFWGIASAPSPMSENGYFEGSY